MLGIPLDIVITKSVELALDIPFFEGITLIVRLFSATKPKTELDTTAGSIHGKGDQRQALLFGFSRQIGQFFLVEENFFWPIWFVVDA